MYTMPRRKCYRFLGSDLEPRKKKLPGRTPHRGRGTWTENISTLLSLLLTANLIKGEAKNRGFLVHPPQPFHLAGLISLAVLPVLSSFSFAHVFFLHFKVPNVRDNMILWLACRLNDTLSRHTCRAVGGAAFV